MHHTVVPNLFTQIDIPETGKMSRVVYEDPALKVLIFGFSAGHEFASHASPVPASMVFLEGEATLTLGEERIDVAAGAWVHMEPRLVHSVTAKTAVRMLLYLHKSAKPA